MSNASLDNLIASSRKSLKAKSKGKKVEDLDSDLDMELDDGDDTAESKKARRSSRRAKKADGKVKTEKSSKKDGKKAKPAKADKAEGGRKSRKAKKADKAAKPAKSSKKPTRAERKAALKTGKPIDGKKSAKAGKPSKMNGTSVDFSKGDLAKFFSADKAQKPGKFVADDATSVVNHFLASAAAQARREYSKSNITKTLLVGVKETFGIKVAPKEFDKVVDTIQGQLFAAAAKLAKGQLSGLRSAAKAGSADKGTVEEAVDAIFEEAE